MLLTLGALGACSLLASDLAPVVARPAAGMALVWGLCLARRETRKPRRQLVWPGGEAAVTLDGQSLRDAEIRWRGTLAFLRWRDGDGRLRHLSWWPDTLTAAARRELRLAASARTPARSPQSMAP